MADPNFKKVPPDPRKSRRGLVFFVLGVLVLVVVAFFVVYDGEFGADEPGTLPETDSTTDSTTEGTTVE